ncbi:NADH:flavin oxidoreductase/NADH oxidase [Lentinus tigrinus ALCF2SS1-6]|uniref:NADH:flavin oxidoreductase/NADH oxidase n=1 Tax=Lentinus tigrinus ALCF2SS1-6 TaxID=1328759 RepID=A0A5C2SJR3_9APHY|nr:NADH:flavin oxidoreductase/NADH oxidase [Lentinus tigrinus ALCF2SS1-6]
MGDLSDHSATTAALFQPIRVGEITLGHRVVFAPLTRCRADKRGVHTDMGVEYYAQRASVPGSLLISEATYVSRAAEGRSANAPGVWNEEQIAAWKKITDAVHAKGSCIFMQLWGLGRAARLEYIRQQDPDFAYVSASDIPLSGKEEIPRPLTTDEVKEYVAAFAQAAHNAVVRAGFDGVEIHAAHGYLIDQFTQEMSNRRTDKYGGSIENRCRFALEVVDAVSWAIGEQRTAIRISPWSTFQDMRMPNPIPTFTHLVTRLAEDHPKLAYLHVVEIGVSGATDTIPAAGETNEFIRKIWLPRPLVSAGGYTREKALKVAEETGQLIAFGRAFVSNPDLTLRLMKDIPLTPWDRDVFYTPEDPHGYIDYPAAVV